MKIRLGELKRIIEAAFKSDAQKYFDALEAQLSAEQSGDHEIAGRFAHKAASLFFVMDPREQTIVSREARRRGLA